jgi:hypothetical protein
MTFEMWKLAYWLIGTLGVAGIIALVVFAPAVATVALNAVVRFLSLVLSTRVGCAVVAGALAWFIADYVRHSIEDTKHAAEVAAFEKAQVDRDKRIAQETREDVLKEVAAASAENVTVDKEVKDFADALPKPPADAGNPFLIGADACRLRHLAGQAECGSDRAQGVPAADTKPASLKDRIRKRLPSSGSGSAGHNQ